MAAGSNQVVIPFLHQVGEKIPCPSFLRVKEELSQKFAPYLSCPLIGRNWPDCQITEPMSNRDRINQAQSLRAGQLPPQRALRNAEEAITPLP